MTSLYEKLGKPTYLFDSHCHLFSDQFDQDRGDVLKAASKNSVEKVLDVSIDIESSKKSLEISQQYEKVESFIGIDPQIFIPGGDGFIGLDFDDSWFEKKYGEIEHLILKNRDEQTSVINNIIGLGETGMDFYWLKRIDQKLEVRNKRGKVLSSDEVIKLSKDHQERLFRIHLELAEKYHLPLTVHVRNAEKECLEIVEQYEATGIFHSYTGGAKVAKKVLNHGWGLGVNAIATYERAEDLRNVYRKIFSGCSVKNWGPENFYINGIYFETDSPYLNPGKNRSERNVPANIKEIFESFISLIS